MRDDGFVLIVSDRPDDARALARNIGLVMECRVASPAGTLPAGTVRAIVVDLARQTLLPADGPLARTRGPGVPLLYIAREEHEAEVQRARSLRAAAVVSSRLSRTAILAALLRVIDEGARSGVPSLRSSPATAPRRVRAAAHAAKAGHLVKGFFDAAKANRPLAVAEVDAGAEIVMEAIEDAGIRAWLDVVWAHDDHLYQHALSVTGYAAAFAGALRFSRADRMRLAKAALLHDVGKTKIPSAVLNKPGKLDAAETAIMRRHPVIGEELLATQPGFDADMLDVVRHHHEMLDGSGYPDGLSGAQIEDLVRLVTVCDIFSALTERRPYRAPMQPATAFAFMENMGGRIDSMLLKAYQPVSVQAAEPAEA